MLTRKHKTKGTSKTEILERKCRTFDPRVDPSRLNRRSFDFSECLLDLRWSGPEMTSSESFVAVLISSLDRDGCECLSSAGSKGGV